MDLTPLVRVVFALGWRPRALAAAIALAVSMLVASPAHAADQSMPDPVLFDEGFSSYLVVGDPPPEPATALEELGATSASVSTTPASWSPDMTRLALKCLAGGTSEWNDPSPTYDPDGDLAPYSDARGATMMAPQRVRTIGDATLEAAKPRCGAELFGHAFENDRPAKEKLPPPAHVDPADLCRLSAPPQAMLLERLRLVAGPAPQPDGVRRSIERPPTAC
jgi:hypothetical protein